MKQPAEFRGTAQNTVAEMVINTGRRQQWQLRDGDGDEAGRRTNAKPEGGGEDLSTLRKTAT